MHAIVAECLEKNFDVKAVDCVSFKVKKGSIFALLGPNGAGKTTLMGILTTLIKPDSGYAEVAGFSIGEKMEVRKRIGVVFQEPALDTKLTAKENLEFHAMLYGMKRKEREERIPSALKLVGLEKWENVLVEKFSGGMKRKLEIARAFVHEPEVLFLDEPTLGLDVQTRRNIWDYITSLRDRGVTIFMTTHYIDEAENLCDTVAIMDRGRIVKIGKVDELKKELGEGTVYIELEKADVSKLKSLEGVIDVILSGNVVQINCTNVELLLPKLFKLLDGIKSVKVKNPDLEDVFLKLTGRRFE